MELGHLNFSQRWCHVLTSGLRLPPSRKLFGSWISSVQFWGGNRSTAADTGRRLYAPREQPSRHRFASSIVEKLR